MTEPTPARPEPTRVLAFDEYELDLAGFELRRAGALVPLEPQVFEVLAYLVRNSSRVVSKDELLDQVWPDRYVTDGVLNSRIMTARKAIGDSGQEQRYIKTIHGRGYRFIGQVAEAGTAVAAVTVPVPSSPAVASAQPAPLPLVAPETTSFVGREQELLRLSQLIANPGARLISIVGPGGVGKTRLALEAANRTRASGTSLAFVPLEAVVDPREIPGAIATALGLALRSEDPPSEVLNYLSGRADILVLDNFEQLLEAAPFLDQVLRAAPGVKLLVTSRTVLGLAGEWIVRVSGLGISAEPLNSEAVNLLLDRASQANALTIAPNEKDLGHIAAICELVDGMPLAIELAASLTPYLSYDEIERQIRRDLSVLASDSRSAPVRHQSIPGLLEASCSTLSSQERQALEALAIFEAPCTAEAADAIAGAPLALLRRLVDRSLVQPVRGRFALHPLMRQFMSDRIGPRIGEVRRAHASYCLRYVASRVAALEGEAQLQAASEVNEEMPDIAAAWRWTAEHGPLDTLLDASYPLFLALTFRGRFFEIHELLDPTIVAAREAGEPAHELLAILLTHRAWVLMRFGRGRDALADVQEALALQAQGGFVPRPGIGLDPRLPLTVIYHGAGDYGAAYDIAMAVLESALERGERTVIAFASWIGGSARFRQARLVWEPRPGGGIYMPAGEYGQNAVIQEAQGLQRAARALLEEMGDSWLRAFVEIELGLIAQATSDYESTIAHFHRAYELRREFNDPQGMASAEVYLAGALVDRGSFDSAEELHRDIEARVREIGDSTGLAEVERSRCQLALRRGDLPTAYAHLRLAVRHSLAIGFVNNVASLAGTIGHLFLAIGEPATAARYFATVAAHPASTPFTRARNEAILDSLSGTFSATVVLEARRTASGNNLTTLASEGIEQLDQCEARLEAAAGTALDL